MYFNRTGDYPIVKSFISIQLLIERICIAHLVRIYNETGSGAIGHRLSFGRLEVDLVPVESLQFIRLDADASVEVDHLCSMRNSGRFMADAQRAVLRNHVVDNHRITGLEVEISKQQRYRELHREKQITSSGARR